MEFIQQNRLFSIVVGLALLAFIVLWPSLFGLGPSIVSLHSSRYDSASMGMRSLQPKVDKIFPASGKGVPVKRAVQAVEASNATLGTNLDEIKAWMNFVPRYPFRIPGSRKGDEDRRREYVSLTYTYVRQGELLCPEYTIKNPEDGVVWLATTRNVPLRDLYFGAPEMYTPPAIKDPEGRIAQLALIHELGHIAIRLNPDEITNITPAEPYKMKLGETEIATAYPLTIRFRSDLPTLLGILHALDGAHGRVLKAASPGAPAGPEEPAEAIKPLTPPPKPKAKGGPADDPEDPGPAAAPAPAPAAAPAPAPEGETKPPAAPAAAPDALQQKFTIRLTGSPSYLSPDATQGTLKERFTIFRPDPANPQGYQFIANAMVTKVLDPGTPKLAPASVLDWRALCTKLRNQGEASEPTAGKRLWALLSPAAQTAVKEIAGGQDPSEARQTDLLGSINEVLSARRDFYRSDDFAGTPVTNEAEGLLKLDRQTLAPERVFRLNRLLLEAAFPAEIARMASLLEATVEPGSDRVLGPEGKETRNVVQDGDSASTRYFFVRTLKLKSNPGALKCDKDGYPTTEFAPPHLEVDLGVAALTFLQVQAPKPKEKAPTLGESPIIHRGF